MPKSQFCDHAKTDTFYLERDDTLGLAAFLLSWLKRVDFLGFYGL